MPDLQEGVTATWEENENPVYARSGFGRELVSLSANFRKAPESNTVFCEACGLAVSIWA